MKVFFKAKKMICAGLLSAIVLFIPLLLEAQSPCNFGLGETVFFSVSGHDISPDYTQSYILVDSGGVIQYVASSPSFAGVSVGKYRAYAINYDHTQTPPNLNTGTALSNIGGDCVSVSDSFLLGVCDCTNVTGAVTIFHAGQSTGSDITQVYALTDKRYDIIFTQSSSTITGLSEGVYNVFAINYDNTQAAPTLNAGTNISDIGGACVGTSEPLGFVVCVDCTQPYIGADQAICSEDTITFIAYPSQGDQTDSIAGDWTIAPQSPSTTNITSVTNDSAIQVVFYATGLGPFVDTVYFENAEGCRDTVLLAVNTNPTFVARDTSICSGNSVDLTALVESYASIFNPQWRIGSMDGALENMPTVVMPTAPTMYFLTGDNVHGCADTVELSLLLLPAQNCTNCGSPNCLTVEIFRD